MSRTQARPAITQGWIDSRFQERLAMFPLVLVLVLVSLRFARRAPCAADHSGGLGWRFFIWL